MKNNSTDTWFTRPCGGREVLTLALPLVISTASWAVMHFIDRTFLIAHSMGAVAAAMPAGTGLVPFESAFPDRFFDVGICEQHAVTFAAGDSGDR